MRRVARVSVLLLSLVLGAAACDKDRASDDRPVEQPQPDVPSEEEASADPEPPVPLGVQRAVLGSGSLQLRVDVLGDAMVHVELTGEAEEAPGRDAPIEVTPMVAERAFAGPTVLEASEEGLTTAAIRLVFDAETACVELYEIGDADRMTQVCPLRAVDAGRGPGLALAPTEGFSLYGLGEELVEPGVSEGDWVGRRRSPGTEYGNRMIGFSGGSVGNVQVPVLMALGPGDDHFGVFVDHVDPLTWDFRGDAWWVATEEEPVRFFLFAGDEPAELRRAYLEITGFSPVPPRRAFGLWVSEYGYDDWAELEGTLATLRENRFPVDGFVLDLQWYGGITEGSDVTSMGSLSWDTDAFPDPAATIDRLRVEQGVELIAIEQSYVGRALPEHADLSTRGYLVRLCEELACADVYLTSNPWWGMGGMIDWTHPEAADYWHDTKRQPLIDIGLVGHWTDLGEPELFDPDAWYHGVEPGEHEHADVHNLYNLLWNASIARGYERHDVERRPFILTRSGTAGSQRYGAALWSGDIGSNLDSLAAHLNAQMHMSMSGFDYFGSDIGGFIRHSLSGDLDEMYTQWLAAGAMLDVPLRPHTQNLSNSYETSPAEIGDVPSNLANVRLRYELIPYLYTLAHRAYRTGEPILPPLAYGFPADLEAREIGDTKLIGGDLLVAITARHGAEVRDVYLPEGTWLDWRSHSVTASAGEWLRDVPLYRDGLYQLPLYARSGAIIPLMFVDEQTMNAFGRRLDGTTRDELIVRVYPSEEPTELTLIEDDGATVAYLDGEVRTTQLSQQREGNRVSVRVGSAEGTYEGAPTSRQIVVDVVVPDAVIERVVLEENELSRVATFEELEQADEAWLRDGALVRVLTGRRPVSEPRSVVVELGESGD